MIKSEKIYYDEPYRKKIEAKIIEIDKNGIILDRTIAYAEGGGQESDRGWIIKDGKKYEFFDVQKKPGRTIFLDDFPTITVENAIVHYLDENVIKEFDIGDIIEVEIDTKRRAKLSISHSVIHIVLMGVEKLYGGLENKIYGAKIKEDGARLDFRTTLKFSQEEIKKIQDYANFVIASSKDIKVYPHQKEKEALYWELDWYKCPCGGTHIDNTSYIKNITVKRKNLGKNGQRISATFEYNDLFQEKFYE